MSELESMLDELQSLTVQIKSILSKSSYEEYGDLSGVPVDEKNSNELFLHEEIQDVCELLSKVTQKVSYLSYPVDGIYPLRKNKSGRYEIGDGTYYTSGNMLEVLINDGRTDSPRWIRSRMEHDGEKYYLTAAPGVQLDGILVRKRKEAKV